MKWSEKGEVSVNKSHDDGDGDDDDNDDGLLDEVFEDLPGNSQAKSQPAPRSPSKVAYRWWS